MTLPALILIGTAALALASPAPADPAPNTLTAEEAAAGWRLLWDGHSPAGWRSAKGDQFPARGWEIADGILSVTGRTVTSPTGGGDIITTERYAEFELSVDFRLTEGANSGIKYFFQPAGGTGPQATTGPAVGLEFQVLDDARHPDAKLGRNGNRTLGSVYDLIAAAADKPARPIGEWNTARIVATGRHVEHWLNGKQVVAYERDAPAFREAVGLSKFSKIPGYGQWPDGHILLQDHGDRVSYRNLKIRD